MQCPSCGSNWLPKYGRSRGKQTYRCGQCLYHFIPNTKRPHASEKVKSLALELYVEGLGLSAISRVLRVKLETVYGWVKKVRVAFGVQRELSRQRMLLRGGQGAARVVSFDEMWTYVGSRRRGKRNSVWIWTAVVEEVDGSRWMDYEVGKRSEATFLRLYERLPEAERYRSDAYRVYGWLPRNRHKVGKGSEVNRNEGCTLC